MSKVTEQNALATLKNYVSALFKNQRVDIVFTDTLPGGAVGEYVRACTKTGRPTITLHRSLLGNPEELLVTFFHECGHHMQNGCKTACGRNGLLATSAERDAETLALQAVNRVRRQVRAKGLQLADLFAAAPASKPKSTGARYRVVGGRAYLISE